MSAPEPAPAPLPPHEPAAPSAERLQRAVDQLLSTADELARAEAAVDHLRARVDRFVHAHPTAAAAAVTPGDPGLAHVHVPGEADAGSVRRVANVVGHTAVAFVVATVALAIADPVLPRPALPFFDTPAAAAPADPPVPHTPAP